MVVAIRFILAIVLYFFATDLLENFFDIETGSNVWLAMEIFSGAIGITAAFFVSSPATTCIMLYLLYDLGSTFWNNKGFMNILILCANPMIQLGIATFLIDKYKEITGNDYGNYDD